MLPNFENGHAETNGNGRHTVAGIEVDGDGPAGGPGEGAPGVPMSLDQALLEMELVGHDFYLFLDVEHQVPSVVYRRKAYDYGVIRLDTGGARSAPSDLARRRPRTAWSLGRRLSVRAH